MKLGVPDFSGINIEQFLMQIAEMNQGVSPYAIGYQNKVERSATGVSTLVQAYKSSLLPFIDTLNQALAKTLKLWSLFALTQLDETIVLRIYDTEKKKYVFKEISPNDLIGKFDVYFDAQALKSATKEVRRNQLMQLIQLSASAGVDPVTGAFIVDMRKLWEELLNTFELPKEYVLEPTKVLRDQAKFQYKAQEYMQKYTQAPPVPQPPSPPQPQEGVVSEPPEPENPQEESEAATGVEQSAILKAAQQI